MPENTLKLKYTERQEEFEALSRRLIEWLNKNAHPHAMIIIDQTSAEIVEGVRSFCTEEYIQD